MSTFSVPALSEPQLANQPPASRLAVIIDLLAQLVGFGPVANQAPLNISSGNKANASAAAVLPGVVGKTTYITGFEVTGSGAVAGLPVIVTVSDGTFTLSYIYNFIAGVLIGNQPLIVYFPVPIPAGATNTAITVTCPASGTGGTNNSVNAHGFQL